MVLVSNTPTTKADAMDLESKLAAAQTRHSEAAEAFAAAETASARAHELCSGTQQANDRYTSTYRAMVRAEAAVVSAESQIRERDRVRLTADDLKAATHVRTLTGWHKVVRVNATSVTVETGRSWTDRYQLADVLAAHTVSAA